MRAKLNSRLPEEVYQRPASPFVYQFLGDVNLFHARSEDGKTLLGMPAWQKGIRTQVFVRPHLLDVNTRSDGNEHFIAQVHHINAAGPSVKLELLTASGEFIDVTISQERYRQLGLARNTQVYVTAREMRVFVEDYVI